jgi:hypothetical protein
MGGCKILSDIRGGKFNENFLACRIRSISQSRSFVDAVAMFAVVDIGKEKSGDDLGGEEESNMDAILEGKSKEDMRLDLDRESHQP